MIETKLPHAGNRNSRACLKAQLSGVNCKHALSALATGAVHSESVRLSASLLELDAVRRGDCALSIDRRRIRPPHRGAGVVRRRFFHLGLCGR
jgi:hypothetical protein